MKREDNTQWKACSKNIYLMGGKNDAQWETYSEGKPQIEPPRKRARYTQQTSETRVLSEQDSQQTTETNGLSEQDTHTMIRRQDRWGMDILIQAGQQTYRQNKTTLLQLCELTELIRRRMVAQEEEDTQNEEAGDNVEVAATSSYKQQRNI